ncbi:MAG TPA: hypothetical protein VH210_10315 [Gaiellaceae bacterium]|jgi:hypothetical protein|nr:hypothetical protein [Gaiellaceae bacterium]
MPTLKALAPDGSPVEGFVFEGNAVTWLGPGPVDAGIRVELELAATDDPNWLVPGLFYRSNRTEECTRIYPRFTPGHVDVERMESDAWSFRADRCSTPAVFARGGGLVTSEVGPLGQSGVGFAYRDGHPTIWLDFPYREEPLRYDGSETAVAPDVRTHRWQPGERVELQYDVVDDDHVRVLRRLQTPFDDPGWVPVAEAAELAAWGLYRWHYKPDPPRLLETAAFDRDAFGDRGDRDNMHVSWVSGAPYAYALLRHGRRVGNDDYVRAAESVLDHIAANLTPGGTYWAQWTAEKGWTTGWHPDRSRLHARTLADAALFMLRARGRWEASARSNIAVAVRTQREDGALPAAHHVETGDAVAWDGTAGMAWIPALVAAGELDAAHRAGAYYATFDAWYGAPEDVDLAPTSEDGYAALMAFVALEDWENATRAADWLLTFRYTYDVAFSDKTLLGKYDFRTRGADNASPANQHLHAFGLICLKELVELGRATGDDYYVQSARENLSCFRQFIAREDGDFDAYRGMASERFYQTDCFQAKGMLLTLSHAWSIGVLLLGCEDALELNL